METFEQIYRLQISLLLDFLSINDSWPVGFISPEQILAKYL